MLNPEEELQVRDALAKVEAAASRVVRRATEAWQAIAFVNSLHTSVDAVVNAHTSDELQPECRPGCCFCCSAKVEVSDPEALHIAAAVRSLPEGRVKSLIESLRLQRERRQSGPANERIRCAFLDGDLCSIYKYRPAVCRKAHSLSAAACATNQPTLPQILNLSLQCEVIISGTSRAYEGLNLPAGKHELSAAVLAVLETSCAAEQWYEGRKLLE
ncbi:MAG: YkgJ family cysteine cluster protein [Rhodocyclaceae bacterium]|nr:YkgJ family cysteine cluster protein [Rhodocyclaceae bacterium]